MTDRESHEHDGRIAGRPCTARCSTPRCASPASRSAAQRTIDVRNPVHRPGRRHRAQGHRRGHSPRVRHRQGYKPTLTRHDRYRILYRAAEIIRSRSDAISDLITAECGICKKDSLYEVGRACDVFVFAGNAALNDDGQIFSCDLTPHGKKRKVYTLREPLLGRDRRHHAVQPPAESGRAQGRAVDRDEQPDGVEAHGEDAADRAAARRHPLRGGPAARDVLGRHGRSARNRRRDADQSGYGSRHVHRRRSHRQIHRGEGGLQAAGAGIGRQRPDHRDGGRGPRGGRGARRRGLVQEFRPALHGDQADAGPRGGRGPLRRAAARANARLDLWRPDGSGAGHGHRHRRGRGEIVRSESRRGRGRAAPRSCMAMCGAARCTRRRSSTMSRPTCRSSSTRRSARCRR